QAAARRRMRGNQRGGDTGGIAERRQRGGAQADTEDERQHAIGAAAAVAHDGEARDAVAAAEQPVGAVGEPVLMQGAGRRGGGRERQQRGRERRQSQCRRQRIDDGADEADGGADDRESPARLRQRAGRTRRRRRHRQTGQEAGGEAQLIPAAGDIAPARRRDLHAAGCSEFPARVEYSARTTAFPVVPAQAGTQSLPLRKQGASDVPVALGPRFRGDDEARESRSYSRAAFSLGAAAAIGESAGATTREDAMAQEKPLATLDEMRALLRTLPGPDVEAAAATRAREALLTKPAGALGRLEELAEWLATWQGKHPPTLNHPRTAVFAGNHGVAARGVSAYPASVTAQMVQNFIAGGAAVNQLCKTIDADLRVYEMNLEQPTAD